jgi:hypothetical protein
MTLPRPLPILLLAVLYLFVAAPAAQAFAPIAQEEGGEIEDKRPKVEELCDQFKDLIGKRGDEDTAAVGVMDSLLQEFPVSGPKDRKLIAETIGKSFEEKRKDLEGGVLDNKLYLAAAVCLGEMGPESADILTEWIGHKRHRKDTALQTQLILSLGKTKDAGAIKTLMDLLKDKSPTIISAAAQSLSNFSGADQKERKKIVNDLVRILIDAKTAVDNDVTDTIARELYDTIAAPIITTLQELTGHDERAPEEWQRWWNKNKKSDWDAED